MALITFVGAVLFSFVALQAEAVVAFLVDLLGMFLVMAFVAVVYNQLVLPVRERDISSQGGKFDHIRPMGGSY
jgi:hypothetical protein